MSDDPIDTAFVVVMSFLAAAGLLLVAAVAIGVVVQFGWRAIAVEGVLCGVAALIYRRLKDA